MSNRSKPIFCVPKINFPSRTHTSPAKLTITKTPVLLVITTRPPAGTTTPVILTTGVGNGAPSTEHRRMTPRNAYPKCMRMCATAPHTKDTTTTRKQKPMRTGNNQLCHPLPPPPIKAQRLEPAHRPNPPTHPPLRTYSIPQTSRHTSAEHSPTFLPHIDPP